MQCCKITLLLPLIQTLFRMRVTLEARSEAAASDPCSWHGFRKQASKQASKHSERLPFPSSACRLTPRRTGTARLSLHLDSWPRLLRPPLFGGSGGMGSAGQKDSCSASGVQIILRDNSVSRSSGSLSVYHFELDTSLRPRPGGFT